MYGPYLDSDLDILTVKENKTFMRHGVIWTLAEYLMILRDYVLWIILKCDNVILIMFKQQPIASLSFRDTYWNIYE